MTDDAPSLLDALLRVSMRATAIVTTVGTAHGLSLSQVRIFAALRDHEPTMGELAAHLGVDRSSASGLIDRASARGLVTRVTSADDRRVVRVALTAEGRAFAARLEDAVDAAVAPLLDPLAPAERTRLRSLLVAMLDGVR